MKGKTIGLYYIFMNLSVFNLCAMLFMNSQMC